MHSLPVRPRPTARRPVRRQRGAALLTAMIIVTLVATLATSMVWQQWRAVQVESAERARAQSAWVLLGALDFSRLILREDARNTKKKPFTALTEPWATPLAEARLSTFLAVDKSNADEGPEAFLSGSIEDAQARYNLGNLVNKEGKIVPAELDTLEQLCKTVGVDSSVAQRIANGLLAATPVPGQAANPAAPLMPETVAQLAWFGVDSAPLQKLQPYVVLLPYSVGVNVNTASREVLAATIKGLDVASAERLVQMRQRTPFKDLDSFSKEVPAQAPEAPPNLTVLSHYFEVRGRLRLAERVLVERSLVQRVEAQGNIWQINVLRRERASSLEEAGN